jgi:tRNA-modifying protein YgfZ
MTNSPLLQWPGAVAASRPDEGVAAHYGDPFREQRALDSAHAPAGPVAGPAAGGFADRSNRGVVTITGQDRRSWLHSLTTQHLLELAPGDAAQALILDPNGHVEHHLTLTDDGTTLWIHVEPGAAAPLVAFLDSMRFMLRVDVADVTQDYAVLTVQGAGRERLTDGLDGVLIPGTAGRSDISDLIVRRDLLADTAAELVRRGGAVAGMWAFEALRIAARVPRLGVDTDHRTLPHEMGWIETAVHLNKGCYRGQETVARVHNLGHPPRRLVFLDLDGSVDRLPEHGDPVVCANGGTSAEVGFTGSAARHYELGPIGLALVKRTVPTDVTLLAGGVAAAQEVIVSPDAGGNVKVTLRRRTLL